MFGAHHHCTHLPLAALALHVPQVAFHLQELGGRRLLGGQRRRVAWRRRGRWGSLWGKWGWIGRWGRGLGGGIGRHLTLLWRISANVWV